MKDKLIKGIQKNTTRMVELSMQGLTEQQCMIDLSQLSFNFVSIDWFWRMQFPWGSMYHSDFMAQELSNYKNDPEATPRAVAEGLNRLAGSIPELETKEDILVGDFGGCGAGSLLLGWLRYAHELHPTRLNQVHMFGVDLDPKMVRMTALQITMSCLVHDIPLGSLSLHCCNAITDYDHYAFGSSKFLAYRFAADRNRCVSFNLKNRAEAPETEAA